MRFEINSRKFEVIYCFDGYTFGKIITGRNEAEAKSKLLTSHAVDSIIKISELS